MVLTSVGAVWKVSFNTLLQVNFSKTEVGLFWSVIWGLCLILKSPRTRLSLSLNIWVSSGQIYLSALRLGIQPSKDTNICYAERKEKRKSMRRYSMDRDIDKAESPCENFCCGAENWRKCQDTSITEQNKQTSKQASSSSCQSTKQNPSCRGTQYRASLSCQSSLLSEYSLVSRS